jgi:hypothetical protein
MSADEQEEYTVEAVRRALAEDPRLSELELDVEVAGDAIVVSGTVATSERREIVPAVLAELFPDRELVSRIEVARTRGPGKEETIG